MTRILHTEAEAFAAGADAVKAWRAAGWTLPEARAEHVAAILAPARDALAPPERREAA